MSELKVTFKLDGVAEEAAKAYKTIQDAFKSKKVSFSEWLESGGETESKAKQAGRKTGKKVMEGIEEGMKDESKRYQRVLEKMANEGEKKAKSLTSGLFSYKAGKPTPNVTQGLREVTGKDLAKVLALGDINDIMQKDAKAANVMAEAMDDLSKRGSQAMVDMQAAMAMADSKINADIEKNIEIGKKEAASYEERAKKAEEAARRKKAAAESAATADKTSFLKNISLLAGPVFNPGGVLSTMFSSRQAFSALMTQTGQQGLGKAGLSGIGGAALGTVGLVGAATAVGFSLKALSKIVNETIDSYDKARKLYASSLISGLGTGFIAKRQNLASILGVSEIEVMQFGAAVAYLNPKIEQATKIFEETNPALTQVSWHTKILKLDFEALGAKLANSVAPALLTVIDALDVLVKVISQSKPFFDFLQRFGSSMLFGPIVSAAAQFLPNIPKEGLLGNKGEIPLPESHMKKLPASTWEKMGLVVGSGGQGTNDLIRKSNGYLKTIADHVKTAGSIPRSFGLDPKTANP